MAYEIAEAGIPARLRPRPYRCGPRLAKVASLLSSRLTDAYACVEQVSVACGAADHFGLGKSRYSSTIPSVNELVAGAGPCISICLARDPDRRKRLPVSDGDAYTVYTRPPQNVKP